jgi:hypothetical protein
MCADPMRPVSHADKILLCCSKPRTPLVVDA